MFNKDFYPTPESVIYQMLSGVDVIDKVILEPSAGRGDIVDYLKYCGVKEILSCEMNNALAKIVKTKSKFLQHDFLTLGSSVVSHIDLIIMNPPFSNSAEHLVKAWEIAPAGCKIISLINTSALEVIRGKYRKELQSILSLNESSQTDAGSCFESADRKTSVDVSIIRITKASDIDEQNDWSGYFEEEDHSPDNEIEGIVSYSFIRDAASRHTAAIELYDQVLEIGTKMQGLIGDIQSTRITYEHKQDYSLSFTCKEDDVPTNRESFKKSLEKKSWNWIFSKMNMQKYMTKKLMGEVNKFVEEQSKVPFTMNNINEVINIVIGTHAERMNKALIEVFEKLTKHTYENRHGVEGWKTNSCYMINRKFIVNGVTEVGWSGEFKVRWNGNAESIDDLQKSLCHMTGSNYNDMRTLYQFFNNQKTKFDDMSQLKQSSVIKSYSNKYDNAVSRNRIEVTVSKKDYINKMIQDHDEVVLFEFSKWYNWGFFEVKGFKKGTMHFKFKDFKLWELVNRKVCEILGELLPEKI